MVLLYSFRNKCLLFFVHAFILGMNVKKCQNLVTFHTPMFRKVRKIASFWDFCASRNVRTQLQGKLTKATPGL